MIRLQRKFPWVTRRASKPEGELAKRREPLREFVYLDEVSLSSLLASQKGEITENTTVQSSDEFITEVSSGTSLGGSGLPSVELNSRFQTTNSNALQTVRKATAQSRFRELYKLEHLRKIQPVDILDQAKTIDEIFSPKFTGAVYKESELERGDLVEFKVELSASWIFQISTMIAEFSDMFDENPSMFMENIRFSDLYQAKNANKIINKLLAGLIPVDGVVSDYLVVSNGGDRYLVQKDVIKDLEVESSSIRIVGVTEHLAYWKDIRRILFANNEFKMLCRISKSGIQNTWNPIKVADIFKEFAPDMAIQIESASRNAMLQSTKHQVSERLIPTHAQMAVALARYADALLCRAGITLTIEQRSSLDREVAEMPFDDISAEGQRFAFTRIRMLIEQFTSLVINPDDDLNIREYIRRDLGIPLFPSTVKEETNEGEEIIEDAHGVENNFLDVEVIAIYW